MNSIENRTMLKCFTDNTVVGCPMFFNGIHNRLTEILSEQNRIRDNHLICAERNFINDRYHLTIDNLRLQDAEMIRSRHLFVNSYYEQTYLLYSSKLQKTRDLYALYVNSLEKIKLKQILAAAIEKLLSTRKRSLSRYYHLVLLLREQKRLQQKIKLLFLPIKIIPDSLRPIDSVA